MKTKIFAAILAVLTAASMAACGNGETDGNSGNNSEDVTVSEETTESKAETEETEAKTESEAETESETEQKTENADDNSAEAGDVYSGDGYTMTIDNGKWVDAFEYLKMSNEHSEALEDLSEQIDYLFLHTEQAGVNFTVVCVELTEDFDGIGQFRDFLKDTYTDGGTTYLSDEVININGKDWLRFEIEEENMTIQYITLNGRSQYIMTYVGNNDNRGDSLSDFEAVCSTFTFTE